MWRWTRIHVALCNGCADSALKNRLMLLQIPHCEPKKMTNLLVWADSAFYPTRVLIVGEQSLAGTQRCTFRSCDIVRRGRRNIVRTTDCCRRDNICWAQYIWQYICWAGGFCTILPPNILPSTDLLNLICNTSASKIFSIRCILRKSIWFVSHVRSYLCAENWLLATCSCQSRRFHILRFSAHPPPHTQLTNRRNAKLVAGWWDPLIRDLSGPLSRSSLKAYLREARCPDLKMCEVWDGSPWWWHWKDLTTWDSDRSYWNEIGWSFLAARIKLPFLVV